MTSAILGGRLAETSPASAEHYVAALRRRELHYQPHNGPLRAMSML